MHLPLVERRGGRFLPTSVTVPQHVDLGAIQVTRTTAHRSEERASGGYTDPGNALAWAYVTSGSITVQQPRASLETRHGAMSVKHFQRETSFRYTPDFHALSIRMDAESLGLRARELDAISSLAYPLDEGAPRLMWSVVAQALRSAPGLGSSTASAMARAVVDFTAVFVDELLGRHTAPEVERRSLVLEGLRHIAVHAADHRLDPAHVADGVHVSLRLLQRAFQAESRSVATSILQARLERAAGLLATAPAGTTIEQVADRSGFRSAAHFSRAFRAHYDHSPSEWRHLRHADRGGA